jgi:hypothetical protein
VLAARGGGADEEASPVSAYSAEKDPKPEAGEGAPMVLKTAVKPPARLRHPHLTPEAQARRQAAVQRVARKSQRQQN